MNAVKTVSSKDPKEILASRMNKAFENTKDYNPLILASAKSYENYHGEAMPEMRKAILASSIDNLVTSMIRSGKYTREYIKSAAVENIWDVDNPVNMLFNLLSVVVPNFAFMEAVGVQPMPTQKSPIIFPQLTSNTARNGFAAGDLLLGTAGWAKSNLFTGNRFKEDIALTTGAATFTKTAAYGPLLPGKVKLTFIPASGVGGGVAVDNGAGVLTATFLSGGQCTYNPTTKVVAGSLAANAAAGDKLTVDYRYDLNKYDPVQVLFEWVSKEIEAQPYRIRSSYKLDNFYAARKTLQGYDFDLDQVLATTMAGYINKEISCGVFEEMADSASDVFQWHTTLPSGVSWAFHRLSVLEPLIAARNLIRVDTARSGGNIIVAGNKLMNNIESLGKDLWEPVSYDSEPIGPYVAGKLNGIWKVIKNQDYAEDISSMTFKKDDTDAGMMAGIHLGLYATDPLGLDTLNVVQGMGTQMGTVLAFQDSVKAIQVTA